MIPVGIAFFLFFVLACVTKSRTYFILSMAYFVNFFVDYFTSSTDRYLMFTYASIDFITCIAVLFFGDIHKVYQAIVLEMMVFCHYLMEIALSNNYITFIESDIYVNIMMFLLVAQIVGADHGINRSLNSLFDLRSHLRKVRSFVSSNNRKSA